MKGKSLSKKAGKVKKKIKNSKTLIHMNNPSSEDPYYAEKRAQLPEVWKGRK
jgi:hypothetical protein